VGAGGLEHRAFGNRYVATAPAVPLLVELAVAHDTPARHWLVELLTYAAVGYDTARSAQRRALDPASQARPHHRPRAGGCRLGA
jgi:hypothetical protein